MESTIRLSAHDPAMVKALAGCKAGETKTLTITMRVKSAESREMTSEGGMMDMPGMMKGKGKHHTVELSGVITKLEGYQAKPAAKAKNNNPAVAAILAKRKGY